ncbi:MAG TPA: PEGA domain-containing protein [Vicinamibacterales bacterium]|nr:PEGA domain-containing protein [Vicinamibacterales bacterium]
MPSQQPSTNPKPRLRGDMYSRAEARFRAELAVQQLRDELQSPPEPTITPIVTVTPPVNEPLLVPTAATQPLPPSAPTAAFPVVTNTNTRRRRTQPPVTLVAALGALGVAAVLGIIFTLIPAKKVGPEIAQAAPVAQPAVQPAPPTPIAAPAAAPTAAAPLPATLSSTAASQSKPVVAAPAPVRPRAPVVRAARVEGAGATSSHARANEGRLRVTSTPAGARVTVNGIGWGQTPVTIDHLPLGAKTVRITRDGYASLERSVVIDGEQALETLSATLTRR